MQALRCSCLSSSRKTTATSVDPFGSHSYASLKPRCGLVLSYQLQAAVSMLRLSELLLLSIRPEYGSLELFRVSAP